MIAIIDYGAGNLRSVKKAFDFLKVQSKIASRSEEIDNAEKIVLPGVGAFGAAAEKLQTSDFWEYIQGWIREDRPFLGICLGMQLLMESSDESTEVSGLHKFGGKCLRFQSGKVPQIGWNNVEIERDSRLFTGINNNAFFYFLHGYFVQSEDREIITAQTEYGVRYPSVIEKGNVIGVQFHPEKSGATGLRLLQNWVELC